MREREPQQLVEPKRRRAAIAPCATRGRLGARGRSSRQTRRLPLQLADRALLAAERFVGAPRAQRRAEAAPADPQASAEFP